MARTDHSPSAKASREVARFNASHTTGEVVRFWPAARDGRALLGELAGPALLLGGHTAVVWVKGFPSCIPTTHIERLASNGPDGTHVLRVKPEHRDTRGIYWRPGGHGYTDELDKAGRWFVDELPDTNRAEPVLIDDVSPGGAP